MTENTDVCSHDVWELVDSDPEAFAIRCCVCDEIRLVYLEEGEELVIRSVKNKD